MVLTRQFSHAGVITEQTYKSDKLTVDFFMHTEDDYNAYEYVYFRKKGFKYKSLYDYHVALLKMYKFPEIKKTDINGVELSVPREANKYLSSIYTKNWKIPDPDWVSEKGPAWNEIPGIIGLVEYF